MLRATARLPVKSTGEAGKADLEVRDATCPLSTRGGTRLVRLVRGKGGGGGEGGHKRALLLDGERPERQELRGHALLPWAAREMRDRR